MSRLLSWILCLLIVGPLPSWAQVSKRPAAIDGARDGKSELDADALAEGFGISVAISGPLAFVGEPSSTLEQGTVTVFSRDSASGTWSQEAVLTASGGSIGNEFGEVIDADGNRVIVGAPGAFGGEGAAYIFGRLSPGVWQQEGVVQSDVPTVGTWYAQTSVSISGDYAVVGETHHGNANQGAAHVYKYDSSSWIADTTLPKIAGGDRFGFSAAISGDRIVVGAYRWNPNSSMQRVGRAYVYERSGATWNGTQNFTLPDSLAYDHFAYDVDIDGDLILATNYSINGIRPPGYRIFQYQSGSTTWVLRDSVANEGYASIGIDSLTSVTGLPEQNEVYVRTGALGGGPWTLQDQPGAAGVSPGDNFGYSVAVSGDYAIVGAPGSFVGATRAYIFERQPDDHWDEVETLTGTGSPSSITGAAVPCSGGMASIFECKDIDLAAYLNRSTLLAGGDMADLWGWTDPVTGHEYALVTHGGGTTFVDITDPVNPIVVGVLPLHEGTVNSPWRDVKTYGNYALVVADNAGPQGIQIFDLTELRGVTSPPVTFSETAHYDKFTRAHNIAINDSSGTAFVVGSSLCGGGIHMVDISNPMAPDSTGCYADLTTGRGGTGYTHDIECVNYHGPDAAFEGREICFGSNETAVLITDVTDNGSPVSIGKGEYPDYGYVHQGWLTDDQRYFILDDELDEYDDFVATTRTLFWDVTDLTDPVLVYQYFGPTPSIDHNQYVRGGYLYQAQYMSGLRILDIHGITESAGVLSKSSIVAPTEVAFFDTYPASNATAFGGAWSVYPYFESGNLIVSGIGEGLFVLQPHLAEVAADLTVLLEGPYKAGSDSMSTAPSFASSVPMSNPYTDTEFDGTALELDIADSVSVLPSGFVDWVVVELRSATNAASAVAARAAILLSDGSIVDPNGNELRFPGVEPGNYYVVVRHRNHLSIMSASAVDFNSGTGVWDFTTASSQAFGANPMKSLPGGRWGMFAGESSLDEVNSVSDFNDWLSATNGGSTGYLLTDFNLDGQVLTNDFNLWLANTKLAAASQVP